jgi:hypothetical protein
MRVGLHVSKFIKFKDIVQGQFIDSYRNLTNKGVMGYKWISKNCMNAEIVLKVDDDAFVNFFKYFEEMSHIKEKKKYILCNRILKGTMGIIRVNDSKWYVNEYEFRHMKAYPHELSYIYISYGIVYNNHKLLGV